MSSVSVAGRLRRITIYLRSSFWFVPACLLAASILLALGLVEVDRQLDGTLRERWPKIFVSDAEGARAMLSSIATSMITVAGVVFSITIVALAQASTQYTSRVLRNFMRDRINQIVLGVFVGVFTYCLLVLRTISGPDGEDFVPSLAVASGLALAVVAIGYLILFIHHIAATIQAGEIARAVMLETREAIHRLFPDDLGKPAVQPPPGAAEERRTWQPVPSTRTGYVQSVLGKSMLEFAVRHDTVVRMDIGVGEFVARGRPLASLALSRPPDEEMVREFNRMFSVDTYRTADQDAEYGFRQLVDIALKALSPAINDTTTAVTCIDYLSALLEQVAHRPVEAMERSDDRRLRVIARGPTFAQLADLAFGQILENAEGNTVVLLRLLRMVEEVAASTTLPERRHVLALRVDVIEEVAMRSAKSTHAQGVLAAQVGRARAACS